MADRAAQRTPAHFPSRPVDRDRSRHGADRRRVAQSCREVRGRGAGQFVYMDIIDSGWFRTHDTRNGHVMYAADLFVHPAARQRGVGSALLAFRWETSMRLCVNRIVGSARLERMPPPSTPHEKYLQMLRTGGVDEPGLRFLLSRGATLLDLLPHHFDASQERCPHAVLTGWDGPPRAQPRSRNGPGTAPQEIHR